MMFAEPLVDSEEGEVKVNALPPVTVTV